VARGPKAVWAPLLWVTLLAVPALLPLAFAETEPNDSFAQATLVDSDSSITGTLSLTDNVDLYKVLLNRTGTTVEAVTAELTKTSSGGQVRLYIYDADGYWLARNATVSETPVNSSVCAPYTGYIYIGVSAGIGAASYDYRLNLTLANLTPDMGLLDGNNRPSEAVAVQDGFAQLNNADSFYDSGDFYSVQLDAGAGWSDVLTVWVEAPSSADLAIELFNAGNSTLIAPMADSGNIFNPDPGQNETLYFVAQMTGTLELRVWAEHGGGQYRIIVSVFRSFVDSDNDIDNATAIPQDGSYTGNVSLNFDGDDYFTVFLRSDTTIGLTLTSTGYNPASRLPNLNLHLLDPTRSYINSSTGTGPTEMVTQVAAVSGDFYIRVSAGRDSAGDYSLELSTVPPPVVLDPEVELGIDEDSSTSLDLSMVFSDQEGRPLAFNFTQDEHLTINRTTGGSPPKEFLDIVPDHDWNGRAVFDINATNTDGKVASAIVNLTVRPVNDPPVAGEPGLSFSPEADRPFTLPVSVFSLFSDVDGDVLVYSIRDPGVLVVSIDADGTVTVTPPLYWSGAQTFYLVAMDPGNATTEVPVSLTVVPVNHAPMVAAPVGNLTFAEHGNVTVDLGAAFWDPDNDTLVFSSLDNIMLGVTYEEGQAIVTARDPHWFGNESITFSARDPSNATATLVVNFTVTYVNDAPYIFRVLQGQSIREDTPTALFNLNGYFRDPHGDALSFTVTGYGPDVSVNISSDGWVTFSPAANWTGTVTMLFSAEDPFGQRASMQFNLTVERVDDAPVLSAPKVVPSKGDTGAVFTFTVLVTDPDSTSVTVMLKAGRRSFLMELVSGDLSTGATYRVKTALPEGDNVFYFQADDGERTSTTSSVELRVAAKTPDNTILYISLLALIIIVVALALAFSPTGGKEKWKDEEE